MDTVTIATFNEESPARLLKQRLEQAKIPAEIQHESTLEWLWFTAKPVVRVRVKVRTADCQTATALLHEWDRMEGIMRNAIRCPECGSSRVDYPQFTRKFFLPNLIGLLAAVGIVQREFYCEECHYTWPKGGHKLAPVRPNSAPNYFIKGVPKTGK